MERTIIIESNRQIANDAEKETLTNLLADDPIPNNKWTTRVESGIPINVGDRISVEASMINVRGSPDQTMEFSGINKEANSFGVVDNVANIGINYYMVNQQKFNFNLPHNNIVIKKAQNQAVDVDFGCADLSTFGNFEKAYPYNSIEDESVTCQRPPSDLFFTNPTRLYYMTSGDDEGGFDGWENPEGKITRVVKSKDFKIPKGFNTPTSVGQTLTEQFHERNGVSAEWDSTFVTGQRIEIVNNQLVSFSVPLITDFSYVSVPTTTGDIYFQRLAGEWSAKVAGETGTEGDGYTEVQGRKAFHKNILCGNPDYYEAVYKWNSLRATRGTSDDATLASKSLYTGITKVADSGGTQVGCLGCYPVLTDKMTKVATTDSWGYSPTGRKANDATQTNLDTMTWNKYTLFPTNIIYNAGNLDVIKNSFSLTEEIIDANTTPLTSTNEKFSVNLSFGRADDSTTFGSEERKNHLPKPNTLSLPVDHSSDLDGVGSNTLANSYITNSDGKKAYIGATGANHDTRRHIKYFTRFVDGTMNPLKTNQLEFSTGTYFQLQNSKGQHGDITLSQSVNVAVVPVFYKNPVDELADVPFCAFVAYEPNTSFPFPYPELGEFFGYSPSMCDNLLAKIVTTQKKQTGVPDGNGKYTYNAGKNDTDYMPYCMIGADNTTVKFDDAYGKFVISDLHTTVRSGNGTFKDPLAIENEQGTQDSMSFNNAGNFLATFGIAGAPTFDIIQESERLPALSAQAGISIASITPYTIKQVEQGFQTTLSPFTPTSPEIYTGSLFDKMGFLLEQLIPFAGKLQNEFNRTSHNSALGKSVSTLSKTNAMVKPLTTNGYISGADQLGIVVNDHNQPMGNLGTAPSLAPVNTNSVSDELVAINVPSKLNFSYLVVYSDIVRNTSYYGGRNGQQKVPAMAYITRNDTTGDFVYQFTTNWDYIADTNYILSDITTDIRLPNGNPADIEKNSAVIYKITKPLALPPPAVEEEPKK